MQKCLSEKVIKGRKTEIKYIKLVSFHSYHIDSTSVSWYLFFIKVDSRSIMSPSSAVLVFLWLWLSLRSLVINSNSAQSTCIHVHAVSIISRMVVLSTTRNFLVPWASHDKIYLSQTIRDRFWWILCHFDSYFHVNIFWGGRWGTPTWLLIGNFERSPEKMHNLVGTITKHYFTNMLNSSQKRLQLISV